MTRKLHVCFFVISLLLFAAGCGSLPESDATSDVSSVAFSQTGMASHYGVGDGFHGRKTASGETFDAYGMTAAHKTLKFGTCLIVTNLYNGKKTKVRVNDRGPYSGGRILDLSYGAAQAIGMVSSGTARIKMDAASCKSGMVYEADKSPMTDNTTCVVYLSTAQQSSDVLTVTIQSRVSSQERPCGKKVNLVKLSEKGESTVVTSFEMASGDGRKSLSLKTSDISDSSQLIAIAVDSQGRTIGQSTQKELR
ncbi:MAG: hypothetical protein RJB13_908 [Pseudomonadota bacterium]